MEKEKSILIVFPDEWLQYSPSVLNLYQCCEEKHHTKLVYVNNGKFKNEGLVSNYKSLNIGKFASYFWRKTFGYKFYKVLRLFFALVWIKIFDRPYDMVIAIDSSGYVPAKLLFRNTIYFSLETEKDVYYKISKQLGLHKLIIQSKERGDYMVDPQELVSTFYIQNAPILKSVVIAESNKVKKNILYMGNIDFGYGIEKFIDCIKELDSSYTLTLKGIRNEKYKNWLDEKYREIIQTGKLIFDYSYVEQDHIIEFVSQFYMGITGYDLELAKKNFNYFSSPAGKLFNYYAAAIPVIGIDIIGLKSVRDFQTGVLMDEVSVVNIQQAIHQIEANYKTYAANCLSAAKAFDFKKSFDLFMQAQECAENPSFSLKAFFTKGHERSIKTKKNILTSVLIKCVSIMISFLLIPLALNYLNPVKYGIWLTLTSVIGWFAFFDMGLGNGLRNKLAEALAKNDDELARTYISTSYAVLSLIIFVVYLIFVLVFPYINWGSILNTPPEMNREITRLIFIVFSFFSLQFIIKLISMILKADQRSAISGGINTLASLLSLLIVFVLTKTTHGSLLWLSVGVSAANIVSPLIASIWFFSKDYKHLVPSFRYVKLSCAKDLMGLGFLFFIMQFAALILFSS